MVFSGSTRPRVLKPGRLDRLVRLNVSFDTPSVEKLDELTEFYSDERHIITRAWLLRELVDREYQKTFGRGGVVELHIDGGDSDNAA